MPESFVLLYIITVYTVYCDRKDKNLNEKANKPQNKKSFSFEKCINQTHGSKWGKFDLISHQDFIIKNTHANASHRTGTLEILLKLYHSYSLWSSFQDLIVPSGQKSQQNVFVFFTMSLVFISKSLCNSFCDTKISVKSSHMFKSFPLIHKSIFVRSWC